MQTPDMETTHRSIDNSVAIDQNTTAVRALYDALACGDSDAIASLLAADLEWWFHGPPRCHYMMQVLTGEAEAGHFRFEPYRITAVAEGRVVAEGGDGAGKYWVHVWTVGGGGVITHFREYFNTKLVVREVIPLRLRGRQIALWQSKMRGIDDLSLPELILAI